MRSLALLLVLLLPALPARAAVQVFACEPEWGALAQAIGGGDVSVYVATSAHQDPHHIDARPSLIAQVRKADLVACTGAGLEAGWLPVLLSRAANPRLRADRIFLAAEQVTRLGVASGPIDRSAGDVHAEGNPHVHLDPQRVMQIGDALAARLANLDPPRADAYRERAAAFRTRLNATLAGLPLEGLQKRRWLVYHDAWPYLFAWLGATQAGTLEPLPGVPPSAQHLARLAAGARSAPVDGILHTDYDDPKAVDWLARNAGTCGIELPYTVGGSPDAGDFPGLYSVIARRLARGCTP